MVCPQNAAVSRWGLCVPLCPMSQPPSPATLPWGSGATWVCNIYSPIYRDTCKRLPRALGQPTRRRASRTSRCGWNAAAAQAGTLLPCAGSQPRAPRPAATRGDMSLPVTPLSCGRVRFTRSSPACPLAWRGCRFGCCCWCDGEGGVQGCSGLLQLGHPKIEQRISFGELLGVPRAGVRVTPGAGGCWALAGRGMLWGCGAQWPFVCGAAPGTSRHPSFPVT